jgi:hypothetical protein
MANALVDLDQSHAPSMLDVEMTLRRSARQHFNRGITI